MLPRFLSVSLCNSHLASSPPATFPCSFLDFRSFGWAPLSSTLPTAGPSALLLRGLGSCHCSGSTPPCGSHVPSQNCGTHRNVPGSVLNIVHITNPYCYPYYQQPASACCFYPHFLVKTRVCSRKNQGLNRKKSQTSALYIIYRGLTPRDILTSHLARLTIHSRQPGCPQQVSL